MISGGADANQSYNRHQRHQSLWLDAQRRLLDVNWSSLSLVKFLTEAQSSLERRHCAASLRDQSPHGDLCPSREMSQTYGGDLSYHLFVKRWPPRFRPPLTPLNLAATCKIEPNLSARRDTQVLKASGMLLLDNFVYD